MTKQQDKNPQLHGHPVGLFTLFFAEMWERFSYYGMRALLVFYMTKGFLGLNDNKAYGIYGAYTALVYATPFIGGMLADRLLGTRRAVVLGGLLMAAGHLLMTIETSVAFFGALAFLIVGNGFFKPNISTIVGGLYPKGSERKDAGFTIFYMGINLGAAMSPVLCGYIGETYGWHYGFGLATFGMLIGVAVFVAPTRLTQLLIGGGSLIAAVSMPFLQDTWLQLGVRIFLGISLLIAGITAFRALDKGGLDPSIGGAPDMALLKKKLLGFLPTDWAVYLGVAVSIPLLALLVQKNAIAGWVLTITGAIALGYLLIEAIRSDKIERQRMYVVLILMFFSMLFWAFFEQAGSSMNNFADRNIDRVFETKKVTEAEVGKTITFRIPIRTKDAALTKLPPLTQEQLGHLNLARPFSKTDLETLRKAAAEKNAHKTAKVVAWKLLKTNVGMMLGVKKVTADQIGKTVTFRIPVETTDKELLALPVLSEKQVGQVNGARLFNMTDLTKLRDAARKKDAKPEAKVLSWKISESNVGMGVGGAEIPASEFQAANPIFILIFGLLFTGLWGFMRVKKIEPSTPVKFALGMLQLGLGFGVVWYGAMHADPRGMVAMSWLLLAYLLHTTGELCLSPVGLSMVTKLSPTRLVSTVMGAWFLATAFSNYLAGMIAKLTGVGHGAKEQLIPVPLKTVTVYGEVFGKIALAAIGAAVICFALAPLLSKWMHDEVAEHDEPDDSKAVSKV